jgi:Capsular polysaccharide biosynthesis protein
VVPEHIRSLWWHQFIVPHPVCWYFPRKLHWLLWRICSWELAWPAIIRYWLPVHRFWNKLSRIWNWIWQQKIWERRFPLTIQQILVFWRSQ